jgi:ketosteroid isomerase-like protein/quercetin dioxygenase-like cupin family protein
MKRYVCAAGLAVALSGACASPINVEQERAALLQRDGEWAKTTGDINAFLTYFADDASVHPPGSPVITGAAAIRTMFTEMAKTPGYYLTWTATKADISAVADIGYTSGTYTAAMGGPVEKGKFVTVWKKISNEWKVVEDIFNADSAGPPVEHVMLAPTELTWGDMPPGLPAGGQAAVVSGNPAESGPFVIRVMLPAGYKVPPHWHPSTENVTVLFGTLGVSMSNSGDPATMTSLPAGGFVVLPAQTPHSVVATTAVTLQIHGVGPFGITYVNPADDPRKK